ncbi:hypothetical protein [Nostoc sp. UHCC 0870]|uniref:hypothetical protein n=1 Tax=Nostoc sp. UHCC 0870 TaxID=2914041 RepID=UPI001EDED4B5|nr:hypothetical protein [Nostoc sp. UHCC 0870]UKP01402.1 hypothetical protein L6494_29645 [Nostoc sp. UHCC 0870]
MLLGSTPNRTAGKIESPVAKELSTTGQYNNDDLLKIRDHTLNKLKAGKQSAAGKVIN